MIEPNPGGLDLLVVAKGNPANNRLIVNSVALHTWETVYIVHKGANLG